MKKMSPVRVSVEWVFGDIVERFKFIDFKYTQNVGLSPVAKQQYAVSALLCNVKTCLYGSTMSLYFQCDPPSLEEYFH